MKNIDREFALKILEKKLAKSKEQILYEAAHETGDWPMGDYELANSISKHIEFAQAIIDHFGENPPVRITKRDIEEIYSRAFGSKRGGLSESKIERYRKDISLVYEIYEEK